MIIGSIEVLREKTLMYEVGNMSDEYKKIIIENPEILTNEIYDEAFWHLFPPAVRFTMSDEFKKMHQHARQKEIEMMNPKLEVPDSEDYRHRIGTYDFYYFMR